MVRREITLGIIVLVFLLVNSTMVSAITGSMGNARMVLYPQVDGSKEVKIEKTILVKNINDVPINVTLVVDPETEKFIQIIDKTFVMEPNTEKKARFTVKVKNEGSYEGKINVFFKPVEGKEAGVVLSSTVIVIAKKNQGTQDTTDDSSADASDEIDGTDNVGITGNVVGGSEGKKLSTGVIFLIATTVLLLIVLVALIVIAPKKLKSLKNLNGRGKK